MPVDDYSDKLIKYVPAEVVAFFIPIGALLQDRRNLLIVAAIVGLVATPGYLWRSAQSLPVSQRPPMHTYVLAGGVSFAVWAIATSAIGGMIRARFGGVRVPPRCHRLSDPVGRLHPGPGDRKGAVIEMIGPSADLSR